MSSEPNESLRLCLTIEEEIPNESEETPEELLEKIQNYELEIKKLKMKIYEKENMAKDEAKDEELEPNKSK